MKGKAVSIRQSEAENYKNQGNAFLEQGSLDEAIASYKKAILIDPSYAIAYNNIAIAYERQNKLTEAINFLKKAIEIDSKYAAAHNNLGTMLRSQGKWADAETSYKKALNLNSKLAEAHYNLGSILLEEYKLNGAVTSLKKAVQLNPGYAKAHSNLGAVYRNQGVLDKAYDCFKQAVDLDPDAAAYYNLGITLQDQAKQGEAIGCFEHVIRLNPNHQDGYANLINQMRHICDWGRVDEFLLDLNKLTENSLKNGQRPGETPFMSIAWHDDVKLNFQIAKSWSNEIEKRLGAKSPFSFKNRKFREKIRIGYLTNNFRDHPVGQLLVGLFESHNRQRFEIYAYSYSQDGQNPCKSAILKNCDKFTDIKNLGNLEAAKKIYDDQIDILVDLNGHTEGHRLEILAWRPAPIQVTYLGFLGTTGASFIDYIITDKIVSPPQHAKYYSEKLVLMPGCYQITNYPWEDVDYKSERADFGLPEDAVVFCCFARSYKIDPVTFKAWMDILKEVKGSVLWLFRSNPETESNLKSAAQKEGINPNRLIFADNLPLGQHLNRLSLADMALDTRIYNGGATTTDALRAGVPVVTLQGYHFASRTSSSMLTAIDLPELITRSLKEYEDLVVKLAKSPKALKLLKDKLNKNSQTQPLFDTETFTRNLEAAYIQFRELYIKGQKPKQMEIKESNYEGIDGSRLDQINAYKKAGDTFLAQGRLNEAIQSYKQILAAHAGFASVYNNLGIALSKQGRLSEAVSFLKQATVVRPRYKQAWANLGSVLKEQGRLEEAAEVLSKALEIKPDHLTYYNLGLVLQEQGKIAKALNCLNKAIRLKPRFDEAYVRLSSLMRLECRWKDLDELLQKLRTRSEKDLKNGRKSVLGPFLSVSSFIDPEFNFKVARSWSEDLLKKVSSWQVNFSFKERAKSKRKLKIGYLSYDFHDHPTAHLMLGLFKLHDRKKFQIYIYSYGPDDGSFYRREIVKSCDKFVDLKDSGFVESAERIFKNQIDILVDLKGHTMYNRMEIAALRPAPVQASYLGFPGTTGAGFFDYIIADSIVVPPGQMTFYSENPVWLPHTYQVNDRFQPVSRKKFTRADFNLPEDTVVFVSFVQAYKIEPVMFDIWMKILKKVPKSVLWLWKSSDEMEKNLKKEADKRGVNPKRLIFSAKLARLLHINRLKLANLALDTRIYNGHTTTSDALWAGVPVVTLQGNHFASRVSSSILTAIDLPELITHSSKEYEDLAIKLAKSPKLLKSLKEKLNKNRLTKPLFDTERFTQNLEQAYLMMWQEFLFKQKPQSVSQQSSIVFFCGPQFTRWGPKSITNPNKAFVGGSEEAVIHLSKILVEKGFKVTVYADPPPDQQGEIDGVDWEPYFHFDTKARYDILVYWRSPNFLDMAVEANKTYLWCHDVQMPEAYSQERLGQITKIIVLSKAHRATLAGLPDDKFFLSNNGFTEYFPQIKPANNPKWCIWTSSYDRGLENLLEIWPAVIKEVPEAKLHIFYGWQLFKKRYQGNAQKMAWMRKMDSLMKQKGVFHHGHVSQPELEKWYKKCGIFAYPSHFYEISCISALKSQYFGAVPVVTNFAALQTTVNSGMKIDGEIYQNLGLASQTNEKYLSALIKALKDPKWQEEERKKGRAFAEKLSWDFVAEQWLKEFKG